MSLFNDNLIIYTPPSFQIGVAASGIQILRFNVTLDSGLRRNDGGCGHADPERWGV